MPGIDLKLLPREPVKPADLDNRLPPTPPTGPAYRFALGSSVLATEERWSFPPGAVLCVALLVPPLLCLGWYRLWQQIYPDEALRLRRRRSRAARAALRGLDLARAATPELRGTMTAAIITIYLKERLDLPVQEPTPHETAQHLELVGCPRDTVARAVHFFEQCDTARFAADPGQTREHVIVLATELIHSLEKEAWRS
jgi:hypothetical protein